MDLEIIKYETGLNVDEAVKQAGNEDIYIESLELFYHTIKDKSDTIEQLEKSRNISDYRTNVHALKSSARIIGAQKLSELAKELEADAIAGRIEQINKKTSKLLEMYRNYEHILRAYINEENIFSDYRTKIEFEQIKIKLTELKEYLEDFDIDAAEEQIKTISTYSYDEKFDIMFEKLYKAVRDVSYQDGEELIDDYLNK